MTLGKGAAISGSWKHKGNSKSSTESEIIGVDDAIGTVLWSLYFLQEHGYKTSHAVIYQDNKSAILLETNGKFSSSKRTKHIKMKFFFVKDKVDDGEIKIEYLPTEEMWIDMHSKPSQGIRFEHDRSKLQNVPVHWPDETISSMSNSSPMTKATPQECVGHHGILRNKSGVRKNILKRWQCHVASRATDFEREDEQLQPNEPRRRVTFLK
jgi:hypothetical protein